MATLISQTTSNSVLELNISLTPEEIKPFIEKAVAELQQDNPLPGFRPGKAPFETAKNAYGDMALLERATRRAVPSAYVDVVFEHKFQTIGEPELSITKLSPDQPVEFTAKVAVMPEVKLGDYKSIKEKAKPVEIPEKDVDQVLQELGDMRAKEHNVDRAATKEDRVIVDMVMSHDKVPIEGGATVDHKADLFRDNIIPGFADNLVGVKKDDKKTFSLPFPKDHYDKKLAGKTIDYDITVKQVVEYQRPPADDAFAQSVGNFKNVGELREQLKKNLASMHQQREDQRLERAIIDKLIAQTTFGDIPPLLIESEMRKMLARLQGQVEQEGGSWDDYLTHLGKNVEELTKDWVPEATTRVKASLLVRNIAEAEAISVTEDEINKERETILSHYPDEKDAAIRDEIKTSSYDSHLKHLILTRKVMERMKQIASQN